jgi:hypothetical protein
MIMRSTSYVTIDGTVAGAHNAYQASISVPTVSAVAPINGVRTAAPKKVSVLISAWSALVFDANVINETDLMTTRDVINTMLPSSGTGQITAAVMRKLLGELVFYDTISDIKGAHIDTGISIVSALGNVMRGDGGGGLYSGVYLAYNDGGALATLALTPGVIAAQTLVVTPTANVVSTGN